MTLIPSTCLSTPSLGITYYCYTCSKSFPARLFQLPLSGSQVLPHLVGYFFRRKPFNSLSRDHTPLATIR